MREENQNEIIEKIVKAYELQSADVADAVELYYDAQELRIMHQNKERTESVRDLTHWFNEWLGKGEKVIAGKLTQWVNSSQSPQEAKWAYSQVGIGPIIAAGLAAHIDVCSVARYSRKFSHVKYDGILERDRGFQWF